MSVLPSSGEFDPIQASSSSQRSQALFWLVFDYALAGLTILLSSDALNRFGASSALWYLCYLMAMVRMVVNWQGYFALLYRNMALLLYPAVCLASLGWSPDRSGTMVSAVQLMMTVLIAMLIGGRFSLRSICGIAYAMILITVVLSLLNWGTGVFGTVYSPSGGLLGIYTQKNALGQRCLIGLICGAALLLSGEARSKLFTLVVLGGMALICVALALSLSVTSILLALPFVCLLFLMCYRRLSPVLLGSALGIAVLVVSVLPLLLALFNFDIVAYTLGKFGKDSSLTGRTELWSLAELILGSDWLLGVGFSAFWRAPQFANFVLMAQNIGGEKVLGFHNFILEIWVGSGLVGLIAMLTLLATCIMRAARVWIRTGLVFGAWAAISSLVSVALALLGTSLYRQHEFSIMHVVMLGVACGDILWRSDWRSRRR